MKQELIKKLGVKDIIISSYNHEYYKDNITIIINDDIAMHLVGKTYSFIPLTENGIHKELTKESSKKILKTIEEELKK